MVIVYNKGKRLIVLADKELHPGKQVQVSQEQADFLKKIYLSEFEFFEAEAKSEIKKSKASK